MPWSKEYTPPPSVLIVGGGVFGLSTARALATRPEFASTKITLVDRVTGDKDGDMPSHDAASMDSSRIIRADYADAMYSRLAAEAQEEWRKQGDGELGGNGRYSESGLMIVGEEGKGGIGYVRESYANVKAMAVEAGCGEKVVELGSPQAIRERLGTGKGAGDWGYLNKNSGWADASKGMAWLLEQVKRTGRVEFVRDTVGSLVWDASKGVVTGARLSDGRTLGAELVIVAAGAWSGALVDLRGLCTATGQAVAFLDVTAEEEAKMRDMPVVLNFSSGLFVIPPNNGVLKVARHAYGYINPVDVPASTVLPKQVPSPGDKATSSGSMRISVPKTHSDMPDLKLPLEAERDLRRGLEQFAPIPSLRDRPFASSRLCWYTDTPTGDYIVDHHPSWKGVFVVTGGSGHGYKFLPLFGEKVVDRIMGKGSEEMREKWMWRGEGKVDVVDGVDNVVTMDGSRSGQLAVVLDRVMGVDAKL